MVSVLLVKRPAYRDRKEARAENQVPLIPKSTSIARQVIIAQLLGR